MAARPVKKRRGPSDARLEAVAAMLPPEALKELREKFSAPPKPKRKTGRPITLMTGEKRGSWNVGPRVDRPGVFYLCLCDCGGTSVVCASLLRRGMSTKCRQCAGRSVVNNLPRVRAKRAKA